MSQRITVGQAIRLIRERHRETQQQMADALGITTVHLSHLENDKANPSFALLGQFRLLYDYDPYLLALLANDRVNLTKHQLLLGKD